MTDWQDLHKRFPKQDDERESEYAMRIAELVRAPWRVHKMSDGRGWIVYDARTVNGSGNLKFVGPYVKQGNAKNRARVLNEREAGR